MNTPLKNLSQVAMEFAEARWNAQTSEQAGDPIGLTVASTLVAITHRHMLARLNRYLSVGSLTARNFLTGALYDQAIDKLDEADDAWMLDEKEQRLAAELLNVEPLQQYWTIDEATAEIAMQQGEGDRWRYKLATRLQEAHVRGQLIGRDRDTKASNSPVFSLSDGKDAEVYTREEINRWLSTDGVPYQWEEVQLSSGVASLASPTTRTMTGDALSGIIQKAQADCANPDSTSQVWLKLIELAQAKTFPLKGFDGDAIQWSLDSMGVLQSLTKDALGARLRRKRKRQPQ